MRKSPVSRLPLRGPLPYAVYHESGNLLHNFDEVLNTKHAYLLKDAGIFEVYLADRLERPQRIKQDLKVKEVANMGLAKGEIIMRPVFAEDGQLVVESGAVVDDDTATFLMKNDIKRVTVAKKDHELHLDQVSAYKKLLKKHIEDGKPIPHFDEDEGATGLLNLVRDLNIVNTLEELGKEALRVNIKGPALIKRLPKVNPARQRTHEELVACVQLYESCAKRIENFFIDLRDEREVKLSDIDAVIADMLKASLRDRAMLLAIMHQPREGEYLFAHTMNVFTLCVNLAILLEFDEALLKELAYAAFFNDVGMMLIDDKVRNKTSKLERQESSEIRNHTTYSVRLAARVKGIPKMLPLIIFQSHEKIDGKGYPRGKKDDEIHDLAKVVSVADAYSAMISNRPYRRGGQPYKSLEEVIHMAGQKKFDVTVVRALLRAVNLFPVGSWVRMTDGSYGVVVSPNEQEYARPWVRVAYRHGQRLPQFPLVGPDNAQVRIDRAIEPPSGSKALQAFCVP